MSAAIEALRREELHRQRELEKQRSAARLGATLYDRADLASMQCDDMRHP